MGTVYQLLPGGGGGWTGTVLYSFEAGSDGNSSISNLVADATGNLYGTTSEGGLGSGTIFKLTPEQNGTWTESIAHSFQGSPDGAFPMPAWSVTGPEPFTAQPFTVALMVMVQFTGSRLRLGAERKFEDAWSDEVA